MVRIFRPKLLRNLKTYESIIKLDLFEQTEIRIQTSFVSSSIFIHRNRKFIRPSVRHLEPTGFVSWARDQGQEKARGNNLLKVSIWNIIEETMREIGLQNSVKTIFRDLLTVNLCPPAFDNLNDSFFKAGRRGQWIPILQNLWWA